MPPLPATTAKHRFLAIARAMVVAACLVPGGGSGLAQEADPSAASVGELAGDPGGQSRLPAANTTTRPLRPLGRGFSLDRIDAVARALVRTGQVPGLAVAVVKDGEVLLARGYGVVDIDTGEPVRAHTAFRLASVSKGFASLAMDLLVRQGHVRWEDPILRYRSDLALSRPGAAGQLTVADVLGQRTGLVSNAYDTLIEDGLDYDTMIERLAEARMVCDPGQCHTYQNLAYSLSGDVIEQASGQPYGTFVLEQILRPLHMEDASVGLSGLTSSASWARPHVGTRRGLVSLDKPKPTYYRVAPAAGINASARDMAQWLLAQGGHRPAVAPVDTLGRLHSPVVGTPGQARGSRWRRARLRQAGYAMGWRIYDYSGHEVVFHGGAVQGYRTSVALVPELDFGVALMWNSSSSIPSAFMPTVLDMALGMEGNWLAL